MKPVFLTRNVVDTGSARIVGDDHLKMTLRMAGTQGPTFDAIGFRMGGHFDRVKSGEPFSVLYTLEENEWNGRRTLQLNIKDMRSEVRNVLVDEADPQSAIATT
jgi:single-stranded-DNA-specific exonuclease